VQTSIPVPSPGSGVIEELLVEDGSKVIAGQQLFKLRLTSAPPAGKI
jgi:2-oxoglutarate dehydrogenase E2 component (dihydrolipoamide succinyltransferase)